MTERNVSNMHCCAVFHQDRLLDDREYSCIPDRVKSIVEANRRHRIDLVDRHIRQDRHVLIMDRKYYDTLKYCSSSE